MRELETLSRGPFLCPLRSQEFGALGCPDLDSGT